MARLPIPGSDQGSWGQILNDYLSQSHNTDGTVKAGVVSEANLASSVVTKLNAVAGQQGATGPQGPAGTNGTNGSNGAVGATGATGVAGSQGPAGATGAQGTQGNAGAAGATGATGPVGPTGADGTSVEIQGSVANAAALPGGLTGSDAGKGYITNDNGHLNVWTGSAWVDAGAVRGPSGPAGPAGATGATGGAGSNGATGATGPAGATGAGATGATGPAGAVGATGPAGGGGGSFTFRSITANTTAVNNEALFVDSTSGGITVTLPAPGANRLVRVKRLNPAGNGIQVAAPAGSYIDAVSVGTDTINIQFDSRDYWSDGTNWYR